ncbi:hypothetical protein [Streptomyces halstedii]|uniref:hypothetical protein n=1 Tax=Streptomyces halstedii TaxID=1944 RepID=UPI00334B1FDD
MARHRSRMAAVLASWCRVVAEDCGLTPPAGPEPSRTAPWMAAHIDWCAGNEWAAVMLAELREVTGRAYGLADVRARRVPLAAQCLTHSGGERCTGAITIVVRGDEWAAHCGTCGTVQEATPYLRGTRGGRWVTAEGVIVLARVFGLPCSRDVVRQWHHRRRIQGRRIGDLTWYDLASVQRYLAQRGRRAA